MPREMMPALETGTETETTMEDFREERADLLNRIINRKTTEAALLLTPGIDVVALAAFAARGETLAGKELDGRERLNYAAIAGFLGLFYVLELSGMQKEAIAARGAAATLATMEFGPDLFEKTAELAREHMPSAAPFLKKTGDFIKDKRSLIEDVRRSMIEIATNDPGLISLNLNEHA